MFAYQEVEQSDDGEYALWAPISASFFMLPYWNPYKEDGSLALQDDGVGRERQKIRWHGWQIIRCRIRNTNFYPLLCRGYSGKESDNPFTAKC